MHFNRKHVLCQKQVSRSSREMIAWQQGKKKVLNEVKTYCIFLNLTKSFNS